MRNAKTPQGERAGLTLLELMLALSLSGLLIFAIGMAIDLHLRTLDARRTVIEESQVARSVMRLISSDLRDTAIVYEQDLSALESLSAQFAAGAAAAVAGLGESGGLGGESGGGGGETGGGESGGGESGGGGAGGGGTGGGGGAGGTGGESGGGETGGGGTEGTGGEAGGGETEMVEEETANTEDIANATSLPKTLGLYGNQYELLIDVARPPRFDEFITQQAAGIGEVKDIPSDVKSIVYYLQPPTSTPTGTGAQDPFGDPLVTGGLVRRRLDRAVTKWALDNGNMQSLAQQGEIIAPEVVALEFRYFDGTQWLLEWDSETQGGLPMAVEIVMMVSSQATLAEPLTSVTLSPADAAAQQGSVYRNVVRIPTAKPATGPEEEDTTAAGLENVGL